MAARKSYRNTRLMRILVLVFASLVASGATFDELAAQAAAARDAHSIPQAIELYQRALELKPAWSEGWAFLGICEFETGEYAHSLEHIRRGLVPGTGLRPETEQTLRLHEALLLTRLGLFDQALPKFTWFVRRGVQNPELIAGIGLTVLGWPQLPKEIEAERRDLVVTAGQTACAWIGGDTAKTEAGFQALFKGFPAAPGVHYFYATYLLTINPEQVAGELKRELQVNPKSADALAMVALLMLRSGLNSTAALYARKAAEEGPSTPMAQYAYGLILSGTGDLRQAIEHLEAAERLDPDNFQYHMALAGAYSRFGRNIDARRERAKSIALAKESAPRGSG